MGPDERRELLLAFAQWMGVQPPGDVRVAAWGDPGVPESIVDQFLAERGEALGYTAEELSGTRRVPIGEVEDGEEFPSGGEG